MTNNIINSTIMNGGGTFKISGDAETSGYCVAVKGFEKVVDLKDFNINVINEYIELNQYSLNSGISFGTWINNNKVYIDLVQVITDYTEAYNRAKKNNEIAIFCLDNFEEIFIDYNESVETA